MKIVIFTDLHGSLKALGKLEQKIKKSKPELIICAGDISIFENRLSFFLHRLDNLGITLLIVHGNHESEDTFKNLKPLKNVIYIHKKYFIKNNYLFLGYGGGGFSFADKNFENFSSFFTKVINENKDKKVVLIAHAPPYKTNLDRIVEEHCGNKSIRKFIENNKVDLVVCGHIHENSGKKGMIKKTLIINPGPFGKIISI